MHALYSPDHCSARMRHALASAPTKGVSARGRLKEPTAKKDETDEGDEGT